MQMDATKIRKIIAIPAGKQSVGEKTPSKPTNRDRKFGFRIGQNALVPTQRATCF
jgi:hypothetical protein